MRAQNKMIFWALLAVAAFAAQHPLMKPLASLHTASLWTTFGVALLIEILAVTIFAVTLVDPVARLEFSQLLKQPAQRQAAFALAVISSISGLAYVYAVARLDPIYVALILNLYPMYALLVNAAMVRKLPPAFAIVTTAIGAAGVPGGALPLIAVVLAQVGVPPGMLALILGVDRIVDMTRTLPNVLSDLVCALWVSKREGVALRL